MWYSIHLNFEIKKKFLMIFHFDLKPEIKFNLLIISQKY